jgi:hypothetical protein
MTDEQYESTKDRIQKSIVKWRDLLYLYGWKLYYHFHRTAKSFDDATPNEVPRHANGCCSVSWEYLDASIHFNLERVHELEYDDSEVEELVVHEFTHCLVNEMREWEDVDSQNRIAHEERVVSHLQRALVEAWNQGFKEGAKSIADE